MFLEIKPGCEKCGDNGEKVIMHIDHLAYGPASDSLLFHLTCPKCGHKEQSELPLPDLRRLLEVSVGSVH